jgi:death on curing protein
VKYLVPQDILVLHARIIDQTGGFHGLRDTNLLASLAERPKATFGGKEMYPSVFKKAAAYVESLVRYHVFVDGNKRTSIAAAARFLFLNRFELTATNKAVESFVLSVAEDRLSIDKIALWLKQNSRKAKT